MKNIVSVSRRNDIPALYGEWFINRINDGYAEYVNPIFTTKIYRVSLKPEDVVCFVFWSKNYQPFYKHLDKLDKMKYNSLFQYTITDYPKIYETNMPSLNNRLDTFKKISKKYTSQHIFWRYDTLIFTEKEIDYSYHLDKFEEIASNLKGYTKKCFISFMNVYNKVKRNLKQFQQKHNVNFISLKPEYQKDFIEKLAKISKKYDIQLYTCSNDLLISKNVKKGNCLDGKLIKELFGYEGKPKPLREDCGCVESKDIGRYDTCINGCVYCYANQNKDIAKGYFKNHNPQQSFL